MFYRSYKYNIIYAVYMLYKYVYDYGMNDKSKFVTF